MVDTRTVCCQSIGKDGNAAAGMLWALFSFAVGTIWVLFHPKELQKTHGWKCVGCMIEDYTEMQKTVLSSMELLGWW